MTSEVMDLPPVGADSAATNLGCAELLVSGAAATGLGQAWLVLQAVVVGLLAELEWMRLRRAPALSWA